MGIQVPVFLDILVYRVTVVILDTVDILEGPDIPVIVGILATVEIQE